MDLGEFYKTQYDNELSRREQLATSLSLPIGVATVVGGAAFAIAQSLRSPFGRLDIVIMAILALALIAALAMAIFLYCFQIGHKYLYLPTAKDINDYHAKLDAYYKKQKKARAKANEEVASFILNAYIECAHSNADKNRIKSSHLANSFVALAVFVALTFLASVVLTVSSVVDGGEQPRLKMTIEVK